MKTLNVPSALRNIQPSRLSEGDRSSQQTNMISSRQSFKGPRIGLVLSASFLEEASCGHRALWSRKYPRLDSFLYISSLLPELQGAEIRILSAREHASFSLLAYEVTKAPRSRLVTP
jgi:hypothetical protein